MKLLLINIKNEMFKKLTINKIYTYLIYILFFLFAINFMTYSQFFLLAIIMMVVLKQIICHEIRFSFSFFCVVLFSLFFTGFYMLNFGKNYSNSIPNIFRDICYYFVFPIGLFTISGNIVRTYKDKQKIILNILTIVAFGFCFYALLNLINRLFMYGIFAIIRIAPDIWTGGKTSATGISALFPMSCSLLFPFVFLKSPYRKWYHIVLAIFGTTISIYSSFTLSNRSTIFVIPVLFLFGVIVFFFSSKNKKNKIVLGIILFNCLLFSVAAIIAFQVNIFGFQTYLMKIPLFQRIFQENGGGFFDSERIVIYENFFKNWIYYPFGGQKIPLEISHYCHNVWLDIYNITGVFPFICFCFITILSIVKVFKINREFEDKFVIFAILCFHFSLLLVFSFEPVLQGNIYIFSLFFLSFGFISELSVFYKSKYMRAHSITEKSLSEYKIVFITKSLSIHQLAFCREMEKKYGSNFSLISFELCPEIIKNPDYIQVCSFNNVYEMATDKNKCLKIINESEIIIYDNVSDNFIKPQLKKGKIVFRVSERLYKTNSSYTYLSPQSIISQYLHHKRYQKYQLRYLCASAYLPYDLYRFNIDLARCYKWGYFTLENNYNDFEKLWANKNKTNQVEIVFVNQLLSWKHPETCLVVARHLREKGVNFRLRIIGSGNEKIEKSLLHSIAKYNLTDCVYLLGPIENSQVRQILEESDILLAHSNFAEGWDVCVSEGMENGCVVIASHAMGSVPFLIDNHKNGIIYEYDDSLDLCSQVDLVIANLELRKQLAENAFNTIKQVWNAENSVNNLSMIISEIINSSEPKKEIFEGPMSKTDVLPNNYFKQKKLVNDLIDKKTVDSKKEKKPKNNIRKGAVFSYISLIFSLLTGLLYTPWMISSIGKSNYSIYTLAASIMGMLAMDLGLGKAISVFLARYHAEKDNEKANDFMGIAFKLFIIIDCVIFVVLAIMFVFISDLYGQSFSNDPFLIEQLRVVFVMVGFYTLVSFGSRPINGLYIANERFALSSTINIVHKLTTIVLALIFLSLGYGLYSLVLINCLIGIAVIIFKYLYAKRHFNLKANLRYRNKNLTFKIISFSIWAAVISCCQMLSMNFVPTLIALISDNGKVEIALWGVALMVEEHSYSLANAFNGLFVPKLSKMTVEKQSIREYTNLMIFVGRIQLFITGLIIIGYSTLGLGFIRLWLDSSYDNSFYVGLFLIIPSIFTNTDSIATAMLSIKDKLRYRAYSRIITAVIAVLVSSLLIKQLGAIGAALGFACGRLFGDVIILNIVYKKALHLEIGKYFKNVHLEFLIPLATAFSLSYVIDQLLPSNNWALFIVKGFMVTFIYGFIIWMTAIRKSEKRYFTKIIKPFSVIVQKINNN